MHALGGTHHHLHPVSTLGCGSVSLALPSAGVWVWIAALGSGNVEETGKLRLTHPALRPPPLTLPPPQKKLPLMALSTTMAESFKELDPDSSMG